MCGRGPVNQSPVSLLTFLFNVFIIIVILEFYCALLLSGSGWCIRFYCQIGARRRKILDGGVAEWSWAAREFSENFPGKTERVFIFCELFKLNWYKRFAWMLIVNVKMFKILFSRKIVQFSVISICSTLVIECFVIITIKKWECSITFFKIILKKFNYWFYIFLIWELKYFLLDSQKVTNMYQIFLWKWKNVDVYEK